MPLTVAEMGLLATASGVVGAFTGAGEVAGVEEMPDLAGAEGAADGVATDGVDAGPLGRLKARPGEATTDTRAPPSAMKNSFALGLLGGIHWMINEPAV